MRDCDERTNERMNERTNERTKRERRDALCYFLSLSRACPTTIRKTGRLQNPRDADAEHRARARARGQRRDNLQLPPPP